MWEGPAQRGQTEPSPCLWTGRAAGGVAWVALPTVGALAKRTPRARFSLSTHTPLSPIPPHTGSRGGTSSARRASGRASTEEEEWDGMRFFRLLFLLLLVQPHLTKRNASFFFCVLCSHTRTYTTHTPTEAGSRNQAHPHRHRSKKETRKHARTHTQAPPHTHTHLLSLKPCPTHFHFRGPPGS